MKNFILDVDGVLSTGKFLYSNKGKIFKEFGPDDNDALKRLVELTSLNIQFVTADYRGFDITKARIDDMNFPLNLVKGVKNRYNWIVKKFNLIDTIYMSDNLFDYQSLQACKYSIVPKNASSYVKQIADYVTLNIGGEGAVAEACIHLYSKFFADRSMTEHEKFVEFVSK